MKYSQTKRLCTGFGKLIRTNWWWILIVVVLGFCVCGYLWMQTMMHAAMHSDLVDSCGEDYAVLKLHMGGTPHEQPALWRMLAIAVKYRVSGDYKPKGTGGYTGKNHYLALLVSDNKTIRSCYWSFREFRLVFDTTPARWDRIDNLPQSTAELYRFDVAHRVQRRGIWFSGRGFNHPDLTFYYR